MSFLWNVIKNFLSSMLRLFSFGTRSIKNTLNIYIKTNTGTSLSVDLDPKMDIKDVKELVAPKLGLQPKEVKIIFAGKELLDSTIIEDCDLGDQSVLHAVQTHPFNEKHEQSKPLCETMIDLQLNAVERKAEKHKAHFYVFCGSMCKNMTGGKLRVRCDTCKDGALTVKRDPCCWEDVLKSKRIEIDCETAECYNQQRFAQFYFKCSEHISTGENDSAVALYLIKNNIRDVPCIACTDVKSPVLVFSCLEAHVTCLECFRIYCVSRLRERQFKYEENIGYTLPCPAGCENSYIEECHHFKLLTNEQYQQYQQFATEEFVLHSNGVLCPQPGCGMGILIDESCDRVTCKCGFVFCRKCLQGYHIGDCDDDINGENSQSLSSSSYNIDPNRAAQARWEDASKTTIKIITKPCPKCRTPTERDGGCMHMVCTRSSCGFQWCWVCQTEWTRDCMGNHWFG